MAYKGINNFKDSSGVVIKTFVKLFHTDVVYKIDCRDNEASYVGQTGRCLKINEQKSHKLEHYTAFHNNRT